MNNEVKEQPKTVEELNVRIKELESEVNTLKQNEFILKETIVRQSMMMAGMK